MPLLRCLGRSHSAQGQSGRISREPEAPGGPMMTTATPSSLPPGTMGLPFIGETRAFGRNPFRFLDDRQKRYGNVFKSSLFGRKIVFLAGTDGAEAFYRSDNISRARAH